MVSFSTGAIILTATALLQVTSAGFVGAILGIHRRGDYSLWARDDTLKHDLNTCLNSANTTHKPKMVWESANSVEISGLSTDCVDRLDAFNARPEGSSQNAKHGMTDIVNGTSVHVSGMSQPVTDWMHQQEQKLH